jgi:hypothetical protein
MKMLYQHSGYWLYDMKIRRSRKHSLGGVGEGKGVTG